jgi:hypothetical protein
MNFGFETALGPILSTIDKDMPILHFATKSGDYSPQGNRATDTWCGQFMTCSAIKRRGFKFEHVITCNPEDEIFAEKVGIFTRACNAIARFKGARILQIGARPTAFESEFFSEENLMRQFRQVLVPVDLATAYETMDSLTADDPRVIEIAKEIRGGADVIIEETPNSIINQALAENSGFTPEEKAIFEALGNYGKAAAGTLEQAALDAAVIQGDDSDIPTSGLTAVKGEGAINFVNKTLLMGDTIGIRLIADEATKANLANAKVYLGDVELVSAGLCVVNAENGTVDLFINARRLNTPLTFVVEDGAGATCLTLTDTVKHIAAQLVGANAENLKAQATYNLIQAFQTLIAAEQA